MGALSPLHSQAFEGWLAAIAQKGWRASSLQDAADQAGLQAEQVKMAIGDKVDALIALQDKVAEAGCVAVSITNPKDHLFDAIMQGIDVLEAHRSAVIRIWNSRDPGILLLLAGRGGIHVRRMAQLAGVATGGLRGHARLAVLSAILMATFKKWVNDTSPDLSETMAKLDTLLGKAERAERDGLSTDLIGLPGLNIKLPFFGKRVSADRALPPTPGHSVE